MSKPDINFLSITEPGTIIRDRTIAAPPPTLGSYWSDLVHVNVPDVVIRNCVLDAHNCQENAVDGNRAHNLLVEDCTIYAGRESALYTKALHGATFRRCRLVTTGGHSDGYSGDYSAQSKEKTTGVVYDTCTREDGKPFRLSWANADKPAAQNMPAQWQTLLSLARRIYVGAKYLLPNLIP